MMNILKNKNIPILIIILIACFWRLFFLNEIPFTHDEFSTLFRLDFDNLHDLIHIGMKELDNHPIGTQVFYYYLTAWFGPSELVMKLPIALFGILSVFLTYRITERWFNRSAALYVGALMAVLEYTVMQSQIARMYGFGIPFVLFTVIFWDKLVNNNWKIKYVIGFVLSAAVCSYTHYFCLLTIAVIGVTGLFVVERKYLLRYFLSCLAIVILFIPHLGIFFYQLSKGGIEGWLGTFRLNYTFEYLSIVFNNSPIIILLVVGIPLAFLKLHVKGKEKKYRYISLLWFVIPFAIGSIYSFFVSNVMHERVVYFSFPFLLIFLASFIKETNWKNNLIFTLLIVIAGSYSLVQERMYPQSFINHRYKFVVEKYEDWKPHFENKTVLNVRSTYDAVERYYEKQLSLEACSVLYLNDSISYKDFNKMVADSDYDYLYFGRASTKGPTFYQIARNYYPRIVEKEYAFAAEAYLLEKGDANECISFSNYASMDSCGFKAFGNNEYIATVEYGLDTILFSRNNIIEATVAYERNDSLSETMLVSSIQHGSKTIDWRSVSLQDFNLNKDINKAFLGVPIPDIEIPKGSTIKLFVWNRDGVGLVVKPIKVEVRAGNPYVYAGTRKIPRNIKPYCLNH